jgi:hypothetical protein
MRAPGHREGGKMGTAEIVVMAVFGALVIVFLVMSSRQSTAQRARMERFAAGRGWTFARAADSRLDALLREAAPAEKWFAYNVAPAAPPPESVYLFAYNASPKDRPSKSNNGFACLATHTGKPREWPVTIFTRVPVVDAMESNRVEVGGEEFRRKFTVTCSRPEAARAAVNEGVQRVLLEHAAGPAWKMTVNIAGRQVLVESSWAVTEVEWDALLAMAQGLRAAVR